MENIVIVAVQEALDELKHWHDDAEKQYDYPCPGCKTCLVSIPDLERAKQKLNLEANKKLLYG